jgi:hypothetical protein
MSRPLIEPLADIVDATCHALERIPVLVTGEWQSKTVLTGGWVRREWRGVARAARPLVALLFTRVADTIEWHKSRRPRGEVARPAQGPTPTLDAAPEDEIDLSLSITAGPGHPLVGLSASVHGAHTSATPLGPAGAGSFDMPAQRETRTGVLFDLAAFDGTPPVAFAILFVAASQIQVVRNHLWRVRGALAPALGEPLRTLLSRGRRGHTTLGDMRGLVP